MRLIPIAELTKMEDGEAVPAFRGTIKVLWDRTEGTNEHGPWSFQNLVVADGKSEVKVKLKDHPEVPKKAKGRSLYVESAKGDKGMTGIKIKEELYQNKPRKIAYVTASATVTLMDPKDANPAQANPPAAATSNEQASAPADPLPGNEEPPRPTDRTSQQPPDANEKPKGVLTDKQRLHAADLLLIRMANLWRRCHAVMRKTSSDFQEVYGEPLSEETLQSGTATLYIQMARDGQVHSMPSELLPFKKLPAPKEPPVTSPPQQNPTA